MRTMTLICLLAACGSSASATEAEGEAEAEVEAAMEALTALAEAAEAAEAPAAAPTGEWVSGNLHCNNPELANCEEGSQISASSPFFRENCTSFGGTVGEGPCPADNRLGHCDPRMNIGSRIVSYVDSEGLVDEDSAKSGCEMLGGTWHSASE